MTTQTLPKREAQTRQALKWLLPSWSEIIIYLCLALAFFISSNVEIIKTYLSVPSDFYFNTVIINAINDILQRILGREISAALSSGLFFALAGLIIYSAAWLFANFSTEFRNDLAVTKYIHPANVDTKSEIRDFVSKTIFRISVVLILISYIGLVTSRLLPYWTEVYQSSAKTWPSLESAGQALVALFAQVISIHFFVILLRLIFLKKRLLFAEDYHDLAA